MAARIFAACGCDVAQIVAQLRASAGEAVVTLLIDPDVAPVDRAMLIGAIAPLAIELAPQTRIAAIDIAPGAAAAHVAAACDFLESARSTTGQVVRVAADG